MFSSALASGQLGPLMNQFGLPAEAVDAANKGGECLTFLPVVASLPEPCQCFQFDTGGSTLD